MAVELLDEALGDEPVRNDPDSQRASFPPMWVTDQMSTRSEADAP
jgi:hypothetical protein